jgi:pimeloyl-ACP methyl ester carboxylesterase
MTKTTRGAVLEVIDKGSTSREHPAPLLFVHGGCHSAWCWDQGFLDHFTDRGFRAVALSLRGYGRSSSDKSLHRCSMADFVEDVNAVAITLEAPPLLIGHSMGGFIVQHYLEKHHGPAGVLMASIPPKGVLGASVRVMRNHPWSSWRSNVGGPDVIFRPPLRARRNDHQQWKLRATARAYPTRAEIFPGVGHNMMLEPGWPAVAERIETRLNERGL